MTPTASRHGWLRSLRFRLTLWFSGVLALILVGASFVVFAGAQHTLQAETDGFLESEAHRIAAAITEAPGFAPDPDDVRAAMNTLGPRQGGARRATLGFDVVYARLVIRQGGAVPAISPDLARRPALASLMDPLLGLPPAQGGSFTFVGPDMDGALRVLTLPVTFDGQAASLQVAVPWVHNDDLLDRLCVLLALGVPAVLTLTTLGGWVLVRRTLWPISRIVIEAERLDAAALPRALLPEATETDSEIGLLVLTLNRMTTCLHEAFEAQQRFVADASHELRTPLAILRGEMELALSRPRVPEEYQGTIGSAIEEIARMSRIVEGLSFLAWQDAGQLETHPPMAAVDLAEIARVIVMEFQPTRRPKGRHADLHPPAEENCVIAGNADQLQQLAMNLVDNALKHTPPGGDITITCTAADGDVQLGVLDTGIGVRREDLPRVFDRFWRADPSRTGEGSGLGLAICREIAAAHGGTIRVESEPGQGSQFYLHLPGARCPAGNIRKP